MTTNKKIKRMRRIMVIISVQSEERRLMLIAKPENALNGGGRQGQWTLTQTEADGGGGKRR